MISLIMPCKAMHPTIRPTIWLWVSEGKFPKPIKLSPRITIWEEEKVSTWMKEKL